MARAAALPRRLSFADLALRHRPQRLRRPRPAPLGPPRTTPLEAYHQLEAPPAPGGDARRALEAAAGLSAPLREALLLREVQGLSYDEIAELQDVPVGTVRSRLSAARSAVADRLREER